MVELPNLRKGDSKMKIKKLLITAAAVSFAIAGTSTFADPSEEFLADHPNTGELMVTTEIKKACYLDAVGEVSFGEIYPGWMGDDATHRNDTTVEFRCTKGTSYDLKFDRGVNFDNGLRNMKHTTITDMPGMTEIPYWLINGSNGGPINDYNELGDGTDEDAGSYGVAHSGEGSGLTTTETLTVIGVLYEKDVANVMPGSYKDTVTVTLCF